MSISAYVATVNRISGVQRLSILFDRSAMCEETAYHEAAHAFMALHVGAKVVAVTIAPDFDDGPERHGETTVQWLADGSSSKERAAKEVLIALAGPVGEMIHRGEPLHPGFVPEWCADWRSAWELSAQIVPDERKRLAYLERTTAEIHKLMSRDDVWASFALVVDQLLAHEHLEGWQVEEIFE